MKKKKTAYEVEKEPSIRIFPGRGVIMDGGYIRRRIMPELEDTTRGKVSGWSRSSRRRMRDFMVSHRFPDGWQEFGMSLTIPGTDYDHVLMQWKEIKRQFFQCLKNAGWAVVWRLELQRRGMPHIHAIVGRDMSKPLRFQRKDYTVGCASCSATVPDSRSGTDTSECRRLRWPRHCQIYDYMWDVWMHYLAAVVPVPHAYAPDIKVSPSTLQAIERYRPCQNNDGRSIADMILQRIEWERASGLPGYRERWVYWRDESGHTVAAFNPSFVVVPDIKTGGYDAHLEWSPSYDSRQCSAIDNGRAYRAAVQILLDDPAPVYLDIPARMPERRRECRYLDVSGVRLADSRRAFSGAWASAVDVDCRGCGYAWLRYLQDHTSKAHQSQMPEGLNIGRHWGKVNGDAFVQAESDTYVDLPASVHARVSRWLSRLCTRKTPDYRQTVREPGGGYKKNPWAYRLFRYRPQCGRLGCGAQVRFTSSDTVQALIMHALDMHDQNNV